MGYSINHKLIPPFIFIIHLIRKLKSFAFHNIINKIEPNYYSSCLNQKISIK